GMLFALPLAAAETEAAPDAAKVQQTMVKFRDDLQAVETEIISKNISLTTEEATAFWPVFKKYQAEQKSIIDGQIAAVHTYADHYATLTDEQAVAYVDALLSRDQQIHDLRIKYLAQYSKVIGKRKAARVIHISRKLGLASQ